MVVMKQAGTQNMGSWCWKRERERDGAKGRVESWNDENQIDNCDRDERREMKRRLLANLHTMLLRVGLALAGTNSGRGGNFTTMAESYCVSRAAGLKGRLSLRETVCRTGI